MMLSTITTWLASAAGQWILAVGDSVGTGRNPTSLDLAVVTLATLGFYAHVRRKRRSATFEKPSTLSIPSKAGEEQPSKRGAA